MGDKTYNYDMSKANFIFHGRLNDFLERDQRNRRVIVDFKGEQSVKHLAESLGVPHPEIGEVQVNGQREALEFITQDGDSIDIFPIPNGFDSEPRFLLDRHLGRLTANLRLLGFDCLYENNFDDPNMADIVAEQGRILLTRDRRLLKFVLQTNFGVRLDDAKFIAQHISKPQFRCANCGKSLLEDGITYCPHCSGLNFNW